MLDFSPLALRRRCRALTVVDAAQSAESLKPLVNAKRIVGAMLYNITIEVRSWSTRLALSCMHGSVGGFSRRYSSALSPSHTSLHKALILERVEHREWASLLRRSKAVARLQAWYGVEKENGKQCTT